MINFIKYKKLWIGISVFFVVSAISAIVVWGLNFGIDFTGGSLLEVKFSPSLPELAKVQEVAVSSDLRSFSVQPTDNNTYIFRFQDTEEAKHQEVLTKLENITLENSQDKFVAEEIRFEAIGPSVGKELKNKSILATILVLLGIISYISWSFRKVSKPVASWKYGAAAIIALIHDVTITVGVFAVMGKFLGTEINTPFVAAVLTVLGCSVNDTIVVFDRIRENLPKSREDFETVVNASLNQTFRRSIFTSTTTLLALVAIVLFGGDTIRDFALALAVGLFFGTYSSIFLASPLLVVWEKMMKRK